MSRVLFIIRKSDRYVSPYSHGSFGLSNSSSFIANQLNKLGHEAKIVQVFDNSFIDKEVYNYNPNTVIVEALWVTPIKFPELLRLHLNRKWVVRLHSKAPFLATECVAMGWLAGYSAVNEIYENLSISCNNKDFNNELNTIKDYNSIYLPNIYAPLFTVDRPKKLHDTTRPIDIGCFGAIRPLKNQFQQAIAAIMFAKKLGRRINFHVNGTRVEQAGEHVLRNMRQLFNGTAHNLIEHDWYSHEEFVTKVVANMDVGMQVSFSESFNIITADFVHAGIPLLVSEDIDWMPSFSRVSPNSAEQMSKRLLWVWNNRTHKGNTMCTNALAQYNYAATQQWEKFLGE